MIHVATVHWRSDRWIDPQLRALAHFLPAPFRVYAFLNRVPGNHRGKFFYSSTEPIKDHATKLNLLGDLISFAVEDPADLLVFIDGDAFPVAPIGPLADELLGRHGLVAVQRRENKGDVQPHPCFCVTTVGFWREIGGDWHRPYPRLDQEGLPVTDVGANLLEALKLAGVDWYPLRRVNSVDLHPLLFALYGDAEHGPVVYHHGAGFRKAAGGKVILMRAATEGLHTRSRAASLIPKVGLLRGFMRLDPARDVRESIRETHQLSEEIFGELQRDEEFWRRFA